MSYIGSEIVQSRIWIDPEEKPLPLLNYKLTYPITVFDAVRKDMYDQDSQTLTQALENIQTELRGKQDIIPAKPANNIMTYGGIAGGIGSIEITTHIPYDIDVMSDDKIPTEKAIGRLFQDYGIIPGEGQIPEIVLWKNVVGRPTIYSDIGDDENGVINQSGLTNIFNNINTRIDDIWSDLDSSPLANRLQNHMNDTNNPHNITPDIIGAIGRVEFENHTGNYFNPHRVTAAQVGLGNVDNTSDYDKPISRSTQAAIDQLNELISNITGLIGDIKYVVDIQYTQSNGRLDVRYNDGSEIGVTIVTDGLIDEIIPDPENHALIVQELNGTQTSIDLQTLILDYIGSEGTNINIDIDDTNTIHATIVPKSIRATDIADGSLINSLFAYKTIGGDKIQDLTITTRNLGNGIVTADKIADGTITENQIDTHTITGRNLFTTNIPNSVLAIRNTEGDAEWVRVTGNMIEQSTITGLNIASNTIEFENLKDGAVTSAKLNDGAVITSKISNGAITADKISQGTITGTEISNDIIFNGNPKLLNTPDYDADDKEIVSADWVRYQINHYEIEIPDRSILGRHLFSSDVKNRVLAVTETNGDPIYTQINSEMITDSAVTTDKVLDNSITSEKIDTNAITTDKISANSITSIKIAEGEVKSENIFASEYSDMILGVDNNIGHPIYTKVSEAMIRQDAITNAKISKHAITTDKINPPTSGDTVLTFTDGNDSPAWDKINKNMISNRAVDGEKLFTSNSSNMVLAVTTAGSSPVWTKITDDMVGHITFDPDSINPGSITHDKLADYSVWNNNLAINSVSGENLQNGSITADKIFQPETSSRVLGISKDDDMVKWLTIENEMLDDHIITSEKIWQSTEPHVVLGTIDANNNPTYVKLDENWFEDKAFSSRKLADDITLYGTPTLNEHPIDTSNDHTIADTAWVRATIEAAIESGGGGTPDWHDLPDGTLPLTKLVRSEYKDKIVGVTEDNGLPVYTQVNEGMLENGSITKDKVTRDIELLGNPSIEIRPPSTAADINNNGTLIPDVQWVRNEVAEEVLDAFERYVPPQDRFTRELSPISEERILELLDGGATGVDRPDLRDEFNSLVERLDAETFVDAYDQGERIEDYSLQFYVREREYDPISVDRIEAIVRGSVIPKSIDDYQFADVLPGPGYAMLGPKTVITEYIDDRAVTGAQLFTSPYEDSVLAVTIPNEDPIWTKVKHGMLDNGSVSIENFMPTSLRDKVIGLDENGVPIWTTVSTEVLTAGSVTERILANDSVTSDKIKDFSIGANKFKPESIFGTEHIFDDAIITRKIADGAVTSDKIAVNTIRDINIADGAITSGKLENAIVLPTNASIKKADNERKSLRNITVSANLPSGCVSGEIWFQYTT